MTAEPSMTRSRAEMDAVEFWRQFMVAFYFDKPDDTVAGVLIDYRREGVGDDAVPRLKIQTRNGRRFEVTAHQERLKAALVKASPVKGDRITIRYVGEADKAAPGFAKAKLFEVTVIPPGSPPPGRPESSRGSATENASGAGATTLKSVSEGP